MLAFDYGVHSTTSLYLSQRSASPSIAMNFSKAQIDARLALQSLASSRSRKAVYAPDAALHYRYEGRQFFDLDFPTFTGLFAGLTRQQLSTVARAPDVVEAGSRSRSTLDDSWLRLYRKGRQSNPIWAALSLVGILRSIPVLNADLTRQEAAHHALTEALEAQNSPPLEVIETCNHHVRWLKDTLCRPAPSIVGPTRSATPSSHGARGNRADSRKRSLSDRLDSEDVRCRKKHVDTGQVEHEDANPNALGLAFSRHVGDNGESAPVATSARLIGSPGMPAIGVTLIRNSVNSHSAPPMSSALTLDVGKLATSRTVGPSIDVSSFRPLESGFDDWITNNIADGWMINNISQSAPQIEETHDPASLTTFNPGNPPANDTILKPLPCPTQYDSMSSSNIQEIDRYAVWDKDDNVLGDVDRSPLYQ